MTLRYAYNTNGCAHHRLRDAFALIADCGYDGVAITLDVQHLDPYAPDHLEQRRQGVAELRARKLGAVIETGARFLLDPTCKHEPTLVSREPEARARRVDFLCRALEIAAETEAETVSFWAGIPSPQTDRGVALDWLHAGVGAVLRRAEHLGVSTSFEPEPGMLIETVADFAPLAAQFPRLHLALDTGHCLVTQDVAPHDAVIEQAARIGTVSIEDMKRGVHQHLPFGEGDMDISAVIVALRRINFDRLVCVELSRDSHRADRLIPESRKLLRQIESSLP